MPPEAEPALRTRSRGLSQAMCIACVGIGLALARTIGEHGVVWFCVLLASAWAEGWLTMRLAFWPLTRKMKRATVPNSPIAYWKSVGQTVHPALLVLSALFVLALLVVGFRIYSRDGDPKGLVIGLFFTLYAVPYAVAIWSRWRGAGSADARG